MKEREINLYLEPTPMSPHSSLVLLGIKDAFVRQWFLHASEGPIGFGNLPPVPRQAQGPLPWLQPASLCIGSL